MTLSASSDEDLIAAAINNLRGALSPRQLFWLSEYIRERQAVGFGELHLTWRNGHVDELHSVESCKMSQLPPPKRK